jgi:hypothetical protein
MNEIALHIRFQVADSGGLDYCDIRALNHRLRRGLHNYFGKDAYPIERVLERQQPGDTNLTQKQRERG